MYAFDFHVHTKFSFDSVTPPKLAIEVARRRGLRGMAVTDHDTIAGAIAAYEANRDPDFLVIPGIEVNSDRGDIIGLFLKRDVRSRKFEEVVAEIHEQGALVYLPHPIRTFGERKTRAILGEKTAVDVWERANGRYSPTDCEKSARAFDGMGVAACLCGSDAHVPWEVGVFRAYLNTVPRNAEELLEAARHAALEAPPRHDLVRRAGLVLADGTKKFKRQEFGELFVLAASLPIKAVRRTIDYCSHAR